MQDVKILEETLNNRLYKNRTKNRRVHIINNSISDPYNDLDDKSPTDRKEKLEITTIHKMKGREAKIVFLYDFDFESFKNGISNEKSNNPNSVKLQYLDYCSNIEYVALTRAIDYLYIYGRGSTYKCLNKDILKEFQETRKITNAFGNYLTLSNLQKHCAIDETTKQILENKDNTRRFLKKDDITSPSNEIEIEPSVVYKDIVENSDIKKKIDETLDSIFENNQNAKTSIKDNNEEIVFINNRGEELRWHHDTSVLKSFFYLLEYYSNCTQEDEFNKYLKTLSEKIEHYYDKTDLKRFEEIAKQPFDSKIKYKDLTIAGKFFFLALYLSISNPISYLQLPRYNIVSEQSLAEEKLDEVFKPLGLDNKKINIETSLELQIIPTQNSAYMKILIEDSTGNKKVLSEWKNLGIKGFNEFFGYNIKMKTRFDLITLDTKDGSMELFELKYTNQENKKSSQLNKSHKLQVLLYLFIANLLIHFRNEKIKALANHLSKWIETNKNEKLEDILEANKTNFYNGTIKKNNKNDFYNTIKHPKEEETLNKIDSLDREYTGIYRRSKKAQREYKLSNFLKDIGITENIAQYIAKHFNGDDNIKDEDIFQYHHHYFVWDLLFLSIDWRDETIDKNIKRDYCELKNFLNIDNKDDDNLFALYKYVQNEKVWEHIKVGKLVNYKNNKESCAINYNHKKVLEMLLSIAQVSSNRSKLDPDALLNKLQGLDNIAFTNIEEDVGLKALIEQIKKDENEKNQSDSNS